MDKSKLKILYEDNHLLGVVKPAGVLVQGDRTGDVTLLDVAKSYIKDAYGKPGNVYLGLVHRLDRPVSGVVLYARTSKAASRLVKEFQERRVEKKYLAVTMGRVQRDHGELTGFIERVRMKSRMAPRASDTAKEAVLSYRVLARAGGNSLLEIDPKTGRHHQIRLQLADLGHPIIGDVKYGAGDMLPDKSIALHACLLAVKHPTRDIVVRLEAPPDPGALWQLFASTIEARFGARE
ncbi:MAG: RNA pseudouridine synthase [Candidatus Latescibacterota bacterium]|nr:MAG: RNA pseudouridine synthase [Candidatus Latescibacterota bacterium]